MNKTLSALLENPGDLQRNLQPVLQHLPNASNMVLVIANAHILALITWMLFSDQGSMVLPAASVKAMPQAENLQAFRQLTNAHLFGIIEKSKPAATTRAPETRLNLVLKGILADDQMKNASIIISRSKGGKEEVYGLGDKIPGGILIKEIHSEHVILERQGRLETLRLIKDSAIKSISQPSKKNNNTAGKTPIEALKAIRKNIITNPASFMNYAVPVVVKEKGRQIGYKLQAKASSDLLAQIGIEPTDVITAINGVKLDNPKNSMGALQKLSTANEVNITVQRNGAEVPINIKLQ